MFVITAVFCKIVRIIIYQLYLNKIYDLHHIYNDHPEQIIDLFVTIVKYTNVHLQIDKSPPPSQEF